MTSVRAALAWIGRDPSLAAHLARAGLAAGVVLLFADPAQGSLAARALLAAGLMLWSFDALEQSRHALDPAAGRSDPHRWSNAARQGAFIAALLLILQGATPAAATGALVAAAVFGAFWLLATPPAAPVAQATWDTSRPMTVQPLRRALYHLWPAFSLALIAVLAVAPPGTEGSPAFAMFQAAFLPFVLPLYPARGSFLGAASDRIRVAGLLLLGAGLWLGAD